MAKSDNTCKYTSKNKTELDTLEKDVHSLPNNKTLDLSKLKTYAEDKINVTEKLKFVIGRVENIVGKG